jgi:hypothetical protein
VTGANRHDVKQLEAVLDGVVGKRPKATAVEQRLCGDKTYRREPALKIMIERAYIPHIKQRKEEIQEKKVTRAGSTKCVNGHFQTGTRPLNLIEH